MLGWIPKGGELDNWQTSLGRWFPARVLKVVQSRLGCLVLGQKTFLDLGNMTTL